MIKKWKEKKEEKKMVKKKKEISIEMQKPKIEADIYNNNKKCYWIYTYTYIPISKVKTVQQM